MPIADQRERFACEQLGLRGYETFLPMTQTKRAAAPLFNGYFFVRIVEQWRSINCCFGVLCLVKVGDCPSKMPDYEIKALKAMIDGHGYVRLPEASTPTHRTIAIGAKVKITAGPFSGMSGLTPAWAPKTVSAFCSIFSAVNARYRSPPTWLCRCDPGASGRTAAHRGDARHSRVSVIALAHVTGFNRSTAGERLRQFARRGIFEKDVTGRWRLTEAEPELYDDVSLTTTPEADRLEPAPDTPSRWVRPIGDYE